MPEHPLYSELVEHYGSGPGVLGCYISGSASYAGLEQANDVDFYVLTESYHGMSERIHGGRRTEIRWRTEDEVSLDISRGGPFIYQLLDATIIRDPQQQVAQLIQDAKNRYESYQVSPQTHADIHRRVGEALVKMRSAARKNDQAFLAYLGALYVPLILEAMFAIAGKPAAPGSTAWRWIRKTPGVSSEGIAQLEGLLQKEHSDRVMGLIHVLDQLHGLLTRKVRPGGPPVR